MCSLPNKPSSSDDESWEDLAKNLFGIEMNGQDQDGEEEASDVLEDELSDSDFDIDLEDDEEEIEITSEEVEPVSASTETAETEEDDDDDDSEAAKDDTFWDSLKNWDWDEEEKSKTSKKVENKNDNEEDDNEDDDLIEVPVVAELFKDDEVNEIVVKLKDDEEITEVQDAVAEEPAKKNPLAGRYSKNESSMDDEGFGLGILDE